MAADILPRPSAAVSGVQHGELSVPALALHAEAYAPSGHGLTRQLPTCFQGFIRKTRWQCVCEIGFRMLVIGMAALELECFNNGNRLREQRIDLITAAHAAGRRAGMPPVLSSYCLLQI